MKREYDGDYFKGTAEDVRLIFKNHRPLWTRWAKIIRKYKAAGRLLDVGCGPGYFLAVAERYYEAYGIDISDYAIREAKKRTYQVKLSVGDATKSDFEDSHFDILTCFDLLEHLADPEVAMKEYSRILRNDGLLVLRVPNIYSVGAKWKEGAWFGHRDTTHVSLLSCEDWIGLLNSTGFEILEVFYDCLGDTPYTKKIPNILQDISIKFTSLVLFWAGMKFTKRLGENLCIIACKRR
jgi:SAM-dependent methyltransferase